MRKQRSKKLKKSAKVYRERLLRRLLKSQRETQDAIRSLITDLAETADINNDASDLGVGSICQASDHLRIPSQLHILQAQLKALEIKISLMQDKGYDGQICLHPACKTRARRIGRGRLLIKPQALLCKACREGEEARRVFAIETRRVRLNFKGTSFFLELPVRA